MKQKAFTLLEVMVVLIILGIVVTIAIPSYQTAQLRQERKHAKAFLLVLQAAMKTEHGRGPYNNCNYADIAAINGALGTKFDPTGQWQLSVAGDLFDFYGLATSVRYGTCSVTRDTQPVCPAGANPVGAGAGGDGPALILGV